MNKTIMIIEDDFDTQFLFSQLLEAEGFEVVAKTSGTEALEYLASNPAPNLIFMDLNFPGGSPEDFTNKLRALPGPAARTPIVVVSGKADIADYAERLRAISFVKKPFEIDPLIDLIHRTI